MSGIWLKTGLPRSGKSHSSVSDLRDLLLYWKTEKGAGSVQRVYSNIEGLALPHEPLPVLLVEGGGKGRQPAEPERVTLASVAECRGVAPEGKWFAVDWDSISDGSIVFIDEAQHYFPPRGLGQKPPPHIAFLNVHGHHGLDIVVITQHPKLLASELRRLVAKHQHYRRNHITVGGLVPDAMSYEWDHCDDQLNYKTGVIGKYNYRKEVNACYHSSTLHTKQSFKKPAWLMLPILLIPLAVWAVPQLVSRYRGLQNGKPLYGGDVAAAPSSAASAARAGVPPPVLLASGAARPAAVVPSVPPSTQTLASAAALAGARSTAKFSGCIEVRSVKRCFDTSGRVYDGPEASEDRTGGVRLADPVARSGGVPGSSAGDLDALAFLAKGRGGPVIDKQYLR